ncbi:MAG: choice-of-anchor I family protein [Chitinophagaceae bacterium]|nr:choice-of-anchor I family protein [Chitinophagaceae bacterium]
MRNKLLAISLCVILLASCRKNDLHEYAHEDASTFSVIGSLTVGGEGAAEITAYDPTTKKLFVVTNSDPQTRIDIVDLSNPAMPMQIGFIDISPYGGGVNSVAVSDGKLAAAVEGFQKTDNGKVVIFSTNDNSLVKQIAVGALPDMVTYSHDGKYILSANEGEPNDAYTIDPAGTVSIISVKENYSVVTLGFEDFAGKEGSLKSKGFRIFGPNANFATNIEPEYITIDKDSKTAWVTLQENNGIAKIDIKSKKITAIFPLGFKSYNLTANGIDPSDRDNAIGLLNPWPVRGMYQPDAIAVFDDGGTPYLFTANEGDVREWSGFAENKRVKDLTLDALAFPDATLRTDPKIGRLNVTTTLGDDDADGDYDALYSFGARSFSVWNGNSGNLLYDSKNELEKKCIDALQYDDARSDDKGVEPEGITLGIVGKKAVAFVGLERADAVAIYDVTNPVSPKFIKLLKSGDAPEGLTFIHAKYSPTKKSLLVVSSENDGTIKVYSVN